MAPKSLSSVRESKLLSLSQNLGPTVDKQTSQTEGQEPITSSRPVTPLGSCSEHSSYCQKSLNKHYFAKKTQPNPSKSTGSSKRSKGSDGGLSSRSSISEMFSDKAESAGSYRSGKSGKGVLRELGQSQKEGERNSSSSNVNVATMSDNSFWLDHQRKCFPPLLSQHSDLYLALTPFTDSWFCSKTWKSHPFQHIYHFTIQNNITILRY